LHDVVEDTEVTVSMIVDNFSWRIAEMVDRLTRDRPDGIKLSVATILNSSYQAKDKEVMLIKLFDRLHNIQTLGVKTPEKTKKIVNETLITFITLSMHLGLLEVEQKLLNSCMYYTAKNKEELQKEDPIFLSLLFKKVFKYSGSKFILNFRMDKREYLISFEKLLCFIMLNSSSFCIRPGSFKKIFSSITFSISFCLLIYME